MPDQIDLFSYSMPRFKIDKPIRLIELFAGIGSQYASLKRLGADVTPWKVIEFDRFAVASYNAVHGTDFTPKDITQTHAEDLEITDTSEYIYILTYSFPCVDLSLAGHGAGLDRERHTRSGLLWEVERILDECTELPQVLLLENVPQLISQKHIKNFWEWRRKLESLGYSNYVQLLNAKDYGIPQNRNRCFMVSILGDYYYEFPKKQKLKLRLKDLLEENVDEKYYLSDAMMNYCLGVNQKESKFPRKERFLGNINRKNQDIANTVSLNTGNRPVDNFIKVNEEGITQETFDPIGGGIPIRNATKKGYLMAKDGDGIDISTRPKNHRGTVQKGISQTIKTENDIGVLEIK